jgi:glycosyltransferase involved in cell wall biosynthesis
VLRVGVNAVFLVPGATGGVEVYARELVAGLAARDDVHVVVFTSADGRGAFGPSVEEHVVPLHAEQRAAWVAAEQLALPPLLARHRCDGLHSLANTAPAWVPCRRVVTIHDLLHRVVPDAHLGRKAAVMRRLVDVAARTSHRVVTDSEATARDVHQLIGVPRDRIDVVPLAVRTPPLEAPDLDVRDRLGLGERPLVLSPSAKRPHKNLARLLRAHAALGPGRPLLVLPGYATDHEADLGALVAELGTAADVRLLGWVGADELEALHREATLVAFPSLYEGFGLPVLEAQVRGVPVLTSARGSLAAVAGGAAEVVDPEDVDAIAAGLRRLLASAERRAALADAGRANAARYSWAATVEATVESYRAALRGAEGSGQQATRAGG